METAEINTIKKELVSRITSQFPVSNIILFGSYAYGKPNEDSDLDLLIVLNKKGMHKTFSERIEQKVKIISALQDLMIKVPMDLLVYTKEEWKRICEINSSFSNLILKQGIQLI